MKGKAKVKKVVGDLVEKVAGAADTSIANRTGIALSPIHGRAMIEGAEKAQPSSDGDEMGIASVRTAYSSEADAKLGSVPPPATATGAMGTAGKALKGESMSALMDKLGERLAFERTGTRLWEAAISKFRGDENIEGGPTLAELEQIRDDEERHFTMLKQVMTSLGGDPTALTPSADVAAVISRGLPALVTDARSDFRQSLEAMLLAELADNDGWEMLIAMTRSMGHDAIAEQFEEALADEVSHLERVRAWVSAANLARAGISVSAR